jgi:hypothetical protein
MVEWELVYFRVDEERAKRFMYLTVLCKSLAADKSKYYVNDVTVFLVKLSTRGVTLSLWVCKGTTTIHIKYILTKQPTHIRNASTWPPEKALKMQIYNRSNLECSHQILTNCATSRVLVPPCRPFVPQYWQAFVASRRESVGSIGRGG